jgi:hypothetical protein
VRPRKSKRPLVPWDERSNLPRYHPHSAICRTLLTGGSSSTIDRRCPLTLALCAGAYWSCDLRRIPFGPEAPGSIRRRRRSGFHQPPDLSADARGVLVPFNARIRLGRESRHASRNASTGRSHAFAVPLAGRTWACQSGFRDAPCRHPDLEARKRNVWPWSAAWRDRNASIPDPGSRHRRQLPRIPDCQASPASLAFRRTGSRRSTR